MCCLFVICSEEQPREASEDRHSPPKIPTSSEVISILMVISFSMRFFVELFGLSDSEKSEILDKIPGLEYDRTKSMKLIYRARKIRSVLSLDSRVCQVPKDGNVRLPQASPEDKTEDVD